MKSIKIIALFLGIFLIISCEKERLENSTIITTMVKGIEASKAISGGIIGDEGGLPVLSRGVCWSVNTEPSLGDNYTIDGNEIGTYESVISNANAGKTYFVRAYYINERDTIYGDQVEFTTEDYIQFNPDLKYGNVEDIDGNVYKTIQIGEQVWMAENLKTTRYQNGDTIEHVTDLSRWGHFHNNTSAYVYYNNDKDNKAIHGALNNWHAASDERNIAPEGWRVANVDDWQQLIDYAETYSSENYGHKLRETTSAHWYPNERIFYKATNSLGLTCLPSGMVDTEQFHDLGGIWARFWTRTGTYDGSSCIYLKDRNYSRTIVFF
ncbi:fibrobacter succinogenes major paralogous domain-containing protein [Carboxylicivirga marina]|uniref:Fibrobacter succinogenes major paralogous domain-containing protein n=1 Tax=Carboxylicivirga marina TaxID=2800988 RepID=A0ABS1HR05_9BACT|nr:fibrobacter succinogenes major paralogous domain-containing protein [Carboxylicivirga marina]MBK3520031.1 fibrobacter succinogenes major paralogous domain-containing protein [Carboxylicivirga marina]